MERFSSENIIEIKEKAEGEISAKKRAETDEERWGINYVNYVIGKLVVFNEQTLRATKLYADYVCKLPEDSLGDPEFVFEKGERFTGAHRENCGV